MKPIINSFSPPSSPLFTLSQLPLPLASSPSLFFPLFPAMPQSWLRVLVYDWVTLLCLWSFLSLSIFSYLPALPCIYLSTLSIWVYCLCSRTPCLVVSYCLLWFHLPLFLPPWLPHFVALPVYLLPATAIIYLLSQSCICSPAWSLTHWFCLIL